MTDLKEKIELLEKENQELIIRNTQLEVSLEKVYKTITYSLGDTLIQSTKSWSGFIKLIPNLVALYKKSSKLRKVNKSLPESYLVANKKNVIEINYRADDITVEKLETYAVNIENQLQEITQNLKVACIMDEFTYSSFMKEATFLQLSRMNWLDQLQDFQPDLLFIESAWRGKDGEWHNAVGKNVNELIGIVDWCKKHNVPTVFWNKEDPVHFQTFINTARLFNYVFTTDIDCIPNYKELLKHDRVFWMPFACQPKIQNPIELYARNNAFCFAGAYYVRYPSRTKDLETFVESITQHYKMVIYDRNYLQDDVNYKFPKSYEPLIKGNLPFERINEAYKGYTFGINLNSVKQSQSMFARRVFELMASNTLVVSNFSKGLRNLFGDLVISTDNGDELLKSLELVCADKGHLHRKRLLGLREVMLNHTYEKRLNQIQQIVFDGAPVYLPQVLIIAIIDNLEDLVKLQKNIKDQSYQNIKVVYFSNSVIADKLAKDNDFSYDVFSIVTDLRNIISEYKYVSLMNSSNFYAKDYLLDLVLSTKYSSANIVGKSGYFEITNKSINYNNNNMEYQSSESILLSTALIKSDYLDADILDSLLKSNNFFVSGLALDRYNFCLNGNSSNFDCSSIIVSSETKKFTSMMDFSMKSKKSINNTDNNKFTSEMLFNIFSNYGRGLVSISLNDGVYNIHSDLLEGTHEYLYANNKMEVSELKVTQNNVVGYFETTVGLDIQLVLLFLDSNGKRISHSIQHSNRNFKISLPENTDKVQLGYRIAGAGSINIEGLYLGERKASSIVPYGSSEYLVLTNIYPSYDNLYRNGFVHSRVKEYRKKGLDVDVFCMPNNFQGDIKHSEFEGYDVMTGSQDDLDNLLKYNKYKKVLVHFLDPSMWSVLERYIDKLEVCVWVHGSEIQPWWRREYNYTTADQLNIAKKESDVRMYFWRNVLKEIPAKLSLVFVSEYFANEVMEDLKITFPKNKYHIIHNPISTEIFDYKAKPLEQRLKILSIRPYASAKYANDLSVKAIELLAQYPWFKDLEIKMIGDGVLFDELLKPLRKYPNITIERGFLKQTDIAKLHKEYGVFLCPTRMDAQGVSKDEAMSSGLVVVTNAVTAIPEFCDENCAVMAGEDDYIGMAEGIKKLVLEDGYFSRLSKESADRVRRQTGSNIIIDKEIKLILS